MYRVLEAIVFSLCHVNLYVLLLLLLLLLTCSVLVIGGCFNIVDDAVDGIFLECCRLCRGSVCVIKIFLCLLVFFYHFIIPACSTAVSYKWWGYVFASVCVVCLFACRSAGLFEKLWINFCEILGRCVLFHMLFHKLFQNYFRGVGHVGKYSWAAISLWNKNFDIISGKIISDGRRRSLK